MYRKLKDKELNNFVNKYFKVWGKDIRKVTVISYNATNEYLINDNYLFVTK